MILITMLKDSIKTLFKCFYKDWFHGSTIIPDLQTLLLFIFLHRKLIDSTPTKSKLKLKLPGITKIDPILFSELHRKVKLEKATTKCFLEDIFTFKKERDNSPTEDISTQWSSFDSRFKVSVLLLLIVALLRTASTGHKEQVSLFSPETYFQLNIMYRNVKCFMGLGD